MGFSFDIDRAIQATGHLLKRKETRTHSYGCILKMLYLADRKSLEEIGSPIIGDKMCAMNHGPLLSTVYDLIKGDARESRQAIWERYIELNGRYEIRLIIDPGDDKLSDYAIEILDRVFDKYGHSTFWQLSDQTHQLPEWKEAYEGCQSTSVAISLRILLKAVGQEDRFDQISQDRIQATQFTELFQK